MDAITALHATNHFRRNSDTYADIRNRLNETRERFLHSDGTEKVRMLQKSHAFAALSVQTQVKNHEEAFTNLFADGFPESESEIRDKINMCNYYKNKASYIYDSFNRVSDWETVARELCRDNIDTAHKMILDEFKGVGTVKAPFVLAMLGFTEKFCVDTNIINLMDIDRPNTVVVEKYEAIVDEIMSHFPTLVKEAGSPFLFQWALFDYKRGNISMHDAWFDEVGIEC